jgi:large subunit ribosomal protein L19
MAAETAESTPESSATAMTAPEAAASDTAAATTPETATESQAATPAVKVTTGRRSARELLDAFESEQLKADLPAIYVGDTVKVGVRIREGSKERIQPYEGVVFMLHSPQVASIQVERRGKVRRAKLFYLRDRVGKATRVKQRFDR